MGLWSLIVKEMLVLTHFCATLFAFIISVVANFGPNATDVPYLGIGSVVVFILLFAAHLPLDRICGFDK